MYIVLYLYSIITSLILELHSAPLSEMGTDIWQNNVAKMQVFFYTYSII